MYFVFVNIYDTVI